MVTNKVPCKIETVGKTRQGYTRYWCLVHKSRATGVGGVRMEKCVGADIPNIPEHETLHLSSGDYPGGIAIWGAVPPVYDTTVFGIDKGIHIHARKTPDGTKSIDSTFRRILFYDRHGGVHEIVDEAAIYYMVSLIFRKKIKEVLCRRCSASHLDRDWFAVHEHKKHLCASCGHDFFEAEEGVGNPLIAVKRDCGDMEIFRETSSPGRELVISQKDYSGGLRIWGSNQAILWTAPKKEEEGIHIHGYNGNGTNPTLDDTFDRIVIDGIEIDPHAVRTFMAQKALPHLWEYLVSLECSHCKRLHLDRNEFAYTPHKDHHCEYCGKIFTAPGRKKKTIGVPMLALVEQMAKCAVRPPQTHIFVLNGEA